jgi:hypothetical protein
MYQPLVHFNDFCPNKKSFYIAGNDCPQRAVTGMNSCEHMTVPCWKTKLFALTMNNVYLFYVENN